METVKMNVGERITALSLMPSESNYATLRMVRYLKEKLGLTAVEYKDFGVCPLHEHLKQTAKETKVLAEKETDPTKKTELQEEVEALLNESDKVKKENDGRIAWNKKGKEEIGIEFRVAETELIRNALKELDKTDKLAERYFSLYGKFVKPEEDDYAEEDRKEAGEEASKKS